MDHSETIQELARELKAARTYKRLSQRDLSARVGVRQAHISKIEGGTVDLRASSLIELARALDLEVMLVPRGLVPAVNALAQAGPAYASDHLRDPAEVQTLEALEKASAQAEKLVRAHGPLAELTRFIAAVSDLARLRLQPPATDQVRTALSLISHAAGFIETLPADEASRDLLAHEQVQRALGQYALAADQIRQIRNALAHGAMPAATAPRPAYRLSEEGENA